MAEQDLKNTQNLQNLQEIQNDQEKQWVSPIIAEREKRLQNTLEYAKKLAEENKEFSTPYQQAPESAGISTPSTTEHLNRAQAYEALQEVPWSLLEFAKQSARHIYADTTQESLRRLAEQKHAQEPSEDNPLYSAEEANELYGFLGLHWNKPVYKNEAELLSERKYEEVLQQDQLQHAEHNFAYGVTSLAGAFVGSILDPVNIATSFIPVSKVMPFLKALEKGRLLQRVGYKFLDAAIMTSALEPLPLIASSMDQRDYTVTDSLFNVLAGTVVGGGLGALAEGIRFYSSGEAFHANLAAATMIGNNKQIKKVTEFLNRKPAVATIPFDDLVNLTDAKLDETIHIEQANNLFSANLKTESKLSKIVGLGKTAEEAKQSLRKLIGLALQNDSIYFGYRIDDAKLRVYNNFRDLGIIGEPEDVRKMLQLIKKAAEAENLSAEEYLAKLTDNFTKNNTKDLQELIKKAKWKNSKQFGPQTTYSKSVKELYGKLSRKDETILLNSNVMYDNIEKAAMDIQSLYTIKDFMNKNRRAKPDYANFLTLVEKDTKRAQSTLKVYEHHKKRVEEAKEAMPNHDEVWELFDISKPSQIEGQTQLALGQAITEQRRKAEQEGYANLGKARDALYNFEKKVNIAALNYRANRYDVLKEVSEMLRQEPRNFNDVKEIFLNDLKLSEGKEFDTSMSQLDDMNFNPESVGDTANIEKLASEAEEYQAALKTAIESGTVDEDVAKAIGLDKDGKTTLIKEYEAEVEKVEQIRENLKQYVECRKSNP